MPHTDYFELKEEDFPLTIRAYREDTEELVWEERLEGPGPLHVPALRKEHGVSCRIEVEYPDGRISIADSKGNRWEKQEDWWASID